MLTCQISCQLQCRWTALPAILISLVVQVTQSILACDQRAPAAFIAPLPSLQRTSRHALRRLSAAADDASTQVPETEGPRPPMESPTDKRKRVVVVGGGWAGFGAAKHLAEEGYDVTLLDASPNPGGLSSGWRTKEGRTVEAGIKGFWYQYPNIFSLIHDDLKITPWPLTECTESGLWSPSGLQCVAPVMQNRQRFPSPLGLMYYTSFGDYRFRNLPLADRASMLPLLTAVLEHDIDDDAYREYDKLSAHELFRRFGVSDRLYEEFLRPILLVGLFAPPEELSAAVTLGMLYFYVLGHQYDFDVAWCRGTLSERIFMPLVSRIESSGGTVKGGQFVTSIDVDEQTGAVRRVMAKDAASGEERVFETDAVVMAVGINAMKKLVTQSPSLKRPEFRKVMNLKSLDVISTRVWLDKKIDFEYPSNVFSGFDETVGGTFFHLNDLQDEYRDAEGSVVACDFYHAAELLPLSDEQIVGKIFSMLSTVKPEVSSAKVVDSAVLRFPQAVTAFAPGTYANRPTQTTSINNLFLAGDWVRLKHGAQVHTHTERCTHTHGHLLRVCRKSALT